MNKGFTLVELLGVIIILSVIALIATISVGSILNNSKESLSDTQKKKIEEAAKIYYLKEGNMSTKSTCINLSDLITAGYIEGNDVKDPKTGGSFGGSVLITYVADHYSYEYQENSCE